MLFYMLFYYTMDFITPMAMNIDTLINFIVAGLVWGFIGLERNLPRKSFKSKQVDVFGWLRSYALIAILGWLNVWLDAYMWIKIFTPLWLIIICAFVFSAYLYGMQKTGSMWVTTEYSVIMTYILWVLVMLGFMKYALIFGILTVILLSAKDFLSKFQSSISREELWHTLKFLMVALVILPILPDYKYSFATLFSSLGMSEAMNWQFGIWQMPFFNPYSLWFFVVTMAAIGYVGYILSKFLWKESGIIISCMVWGLVSSTAVTATMSEQSKKDGKNAYTYVVGTLLANSIMLVRVMFVVLLFNFSLLPTLVLPAVLMLLWFLVCTYFFYHKSRHVISKTKVSVDEKMESPFRLIPALQFGIFVLFIKFVAAIGILYKDIWGEKVFYYIFGIISGLADVDAITQTMAVTAKEGGVVASLAVATILIAVMSNNMVKWSIALKFGDKNYWLKVMTSFIISMAAGLVWIVVVSLLG